MANKKKDKGVGFKMCSVPTLCQKTESIYFLKGFSSRRKAWQCFVQSSLTPDYLA